MLPAQPRAVIPEILALAKGYETLRQRAYDDKQPWKPLNPGDTVLGTLTIGYGHTTHVFVGQVITPADAERLLAADMALAGAAVLAQVTVPLTDNQYSALADFVFNEGPGNFAKSTVLKMLNARNYAGAATHLLDWDVAFGKHNALLHERRQKEAAIFSRAS